MSDIIHLLEKVNSRRLVNCSSRCGFRFPVFNHSGTAATGVTLANRLGRIQRPNSIIIKGHLHNIWRTEGPNAFVMTVSSLTYTYTRNRSFITANVCRNVILQSYRRGSEHHWRCLGNPKEIKLHPWHQRIQGGGGHLQSCPSQRPKVTYPYPKMAKKMFNQP